MSKTKVKHVFLLASHPLLGQGVESFLSHVPGIKIVGFESQIPKAIECIKELKPEVVIVDNSEPGMVPAEIITQVLQARIGTKVIGINLRDNTMTVYRGEQKVVQTAEELVQVIKSESGDSNGITKHVISSLI